MKVLRIYHAGRDAAHRERDHALLRAGVDLTLVVPTAWPGPNDLTGDVSNIVELPVRRPGDVNRHTYLHPEAIIDLVRTQRPDVVDIHEEPFSAVTHQLLMRLPAEQPVIAYTAQNIDKRFPPPFWVWERQALGRLDGLYPCSRQAASVAVGKGFVGPVRVLPLAPSPAMTPGVQDPPREVVNLLLVGRLVPEKGVLDAIRLVAALKDLGVRLDIIGEGPEEGPARALASALGVVDRVTLTGWTDAASLAEHYRRAHILLAPSRATRTWVEQFGRMVVEAQACGAVVVGYASGSLPEVVGSEGILVPEGDEAALASAVRQLVVEPGRWASLRASGLSVAATRTWDAVAAGQVALYDEAALHPGPRRARPQRALAHKAWGRPAHLHGVRRPVALPLLRDHEAVNLLTGRAIDAFARRETTVARERVRVVYLDHVARISGGELAMLRLIPSIPDIEAHVILGEDGPLKAALEKAGATVEVMPIEEGARDLRRGQVGATGAALSAASSMLGYTWRLSRRLHELEPDLVHTNSLKSGYYGSVAARLAGLPVVWHLRDRVAPDYLPAAAVRLTRTMLAHIPTMVIANSQATLLTTRTRAEADHGRVLASPTVLGGNDNLRRISDAIETHVIRSAAPTEPVVGIVGRLSSWKGQDVFIQALALLADDFPELRGRIIGTALFGEHEIEPQLRALADRLGIADRLTFVGHTDDVEAELSRLMVLVHASTLPEPFGQVVVEGMAARVPVVATDAGGPAEIITPGVDGLLVPPADAEALAQAISQLIDDPALRDRLATEALETARQYRPEVIGPQMRALYDEVLGQSRDGS